MAIDIQDIIAKAKQHQAENPPTAAEIREHDISFAYGNANISNPSITRQMVADAYDNRGNA